jgi:hypothetical protein
MVLPSLLDDMYQSEAVAREAVRSAWLRELAAAAAAQGDQARAPNSGGSGDAAVLLVVPGAVPSAGCDRGASGLGLSAVDAAQAMGAKLACYQVGFKALAPDRTCAFQGTAPSMDTQRLWLIRCQPPGDLFSATSVL